MPKLWNGRFEKDTSEMMDVFNASIAFEQRLFPYDILGSIAHVRMLSKQAIISSDDAELIETELKTIYKGIEAGDIDFKLSLEDIHMNIESILIDHIGEAGKRLHTGRSRNDQIALDMKLYAKDALIGVQKHLLSLIAALNTLAFDHVETIMPGCTHLQNAQPITFGHHLLAYVEKFKRDVIKLTDAYHHLDAMPLGSSALASTSYPIDRNAVKETLGFESLTYNSLDGVSDRDYLVEIASIYSLIAIHLSNLSEEIIIWNSSAYHFITLDDAYSTGSSIMPQKKNPDVAELCRGKSGRIIGALQSLLVTLKGLPLAYNKDLQEDKEMFFGSTDQLDLMIPMMEKLVSTMTVNQDAMLEATLKGFTEATEIADYLVKKGLAFRECHHIVGSIVKDCEKARLPLTALSLEDYKGYSDQFEADIFEVLDLKNIINSKAHVGGPAFETVKAQIKANELWLSDNQEIVSSLYSPLNAIQQMLSAY